MTSPETRIILAVSGMVREQLLHWYAIAPEKIVVVPNGIDVSRFTVPLDLDLVRREYGMRPDRLAVGFLGNEFERKGVQTIIEALPQLRDIPLDVIVAGADDPGPFRRRAEQLAVSDQVRFVGKVTDPEKFLRSLDLFVFPVNYEPFGMVVIEAMAAGVPVITARTVGAVEGMTDSHHAVFLEDPLSAGELATQIRRVLDDRQLRDRLAAEGRTTAMAFAWPRIISDIEHLYRTIAGDSMSAAGSNAHSRSTPR